MKTILIVYLMLINLIGFAAMALDKRRAIRHKWRIPERTLFLIALLFGSIGVLTGMYVFRHKTKHLSFEQAMADNEAKADILAYIGQYAEA